MQENENQEQGMTVIPEVTGVVTSISNNASELSQLLMSNIRRLKEDPKFIPQAEAINSQVKTLIDLGKTELEAMKLSVFMTQK